MKRRRRRDLLEKEVNLSKNRGKVKQKKEGMGWLKELLLNSTDNSWFLQDESDQIKATCY